MYVRLKDEIIEVNPKLTSEQIDISLGKNTSRADTIEELCDEIVIRRNEKRNEKPYYSNSPIGKSKSWKAYQPLVKEIKDIGYNHRPISDSLRDFRANIRGQQGAKKGKTLEETCPTHHTKYK